MLRLVAAVLIAALSAGCTIYRPDIAQGNVVTQEMVDQLKTGMTRNQVRFVLGTPLVTDPFHPDRWDYYYSLLKGTERTRETHRLTVLFSGDSLISVEGDALKKVPDTRSEKP